MRHVCELDVLIAPLKRMIHDLAEDDRADQRFTVFVAQRPHGQRWKVFLVLTGEIAAKRNAVGRSVEMEAVAISGQISTIIGRKEEYVFAERTEAEAQLLELTLTLAEVVIRHEVSCRPEAVRETLQAALEMAADNGNLKVHLNPEDLDSIKQFLPQLEQRLNSTTRLEIEGDPAISQGGCLLETDAGIIDARLEEQLETLRQQLRRTSEPLQEAANSEKTCD